MATNNPQLYKNHFASLLKFCSDFAAAMNAQGNNLTAVNYDAHADTDTLPQQDCVGIMNFAMTADDHFCNIRCMFGITTLDDTNLFRLHDLSGELFDYLLPSRKIEVVSNVDGSHLGYMMIQNGTRAMPVSGESRPARFFMVNLLSDQTWNLS